MAAPSVSMASCLFFGVLASGPAEVRAEARCGAEEWRLEGATTEAGEDAVFQASWEPALREAIACLAARPDACLVVQGRYDAVPFRSEVVTRALGSDLAAQMVRAQGRAVVTVAHLHDLGAPPDRLRVEPPPREPSWRGARVRLASHCGPRPLDEPASAHSSTGATLAPVVLVKPVAPPTAAPAVRAPDSPPPADIRLRFALGGAVADVGEGERRPSARLRLGAEWRPWVAYVRGEVGFSVAEARTARRGLGAAFGAGWVPFEWLTVGARGDYLRLAEEAFGGWLEQGWSIGLETTACLPLEAPATVCLELAGAPYGRLTRRAVVADDTLFLVPAETSDLRFVEAALSFLMEI